MILLRDPANPSLWAASVIVFSGTEAVHVVVSQQEIKSGWLFSAHNDVYVFDRPGEKSYRRRLFSEFYRAKEVFLP